MGNTGLDDRMIDNSNQEATYIELFITFFKLGLFTIGGGMAMIPLMQGIITEQKKWMTQSEVIDCIAVSQGLPGVIAINMATYIGNYKKGALGSLVATIGVIVPSFAIIIAIVEILNGIGDNSYVNGALTGIKSAATGLILYSAYKIGKQVLCGYFTWIVAIASFFAVVILKINAAWVILAGILLGLIYKKIEKGGEEK